MVHWLNGLAIAVEVDAVLDDLVCVFVFLSHDSDDSCLLAEHLMSQAQFDLLLRISATKLSNMVMHSQFQQVNPGGLWDWMEVFSCGNQIGCVFLLIPLGR